MNLQKRLLLTIGILLLLSFSGLEYFSYRATKKQVEENLLEQAERIRGVLMATRRIYHKQFVNSGLPLNNKTLGFLPAYALNKIAKEFVAHWDLSGFSFNNVSDKPRNPNQAADNFELKAMGFFRRNPQKEVYFMPFRKSGGEPYYLYARPIWIEEYCLECHGKKSEAPPTIRKLYDTGYEYKLGDLRGIISIKLPASIIRVKAIENFKNEFLIHLLIFILIFLLVTQIIRQHVNQPLTNLANHMKEISEGNYKKRINGLRAEFAIIGKAFNKMSDNIMLHRNKLQESEARLRKVVVNMPVMMEAFDTDGNIVAWNQECERVTGYTAGDIVDNPKAMQMLYPDAADLKQYMKECLELGSNYRNWEGEITCKDGTKRSISWSNISKKIPISGWASWRIGVDITERKRMEVELIEHRQHLEELVKERTDELADTNELLRKEITERKLAEEEIRKINKELDQRVIDRTAALETANEELKSFAYVVSHDLKAPLRGINQLAKWLSKDYKDVIDEKGKNNLSLVMRNVNRMYCLIDGILHYSKVGHISEDKKQVNFNSLVHDAIDIVGPPDNIHITIENNLPVIVCEETRIGQVFQNLLSNAVKYMDKPIGEVNIGCIDNGTDWKFSFTDNGCGIEKKHFKKIFKIFQTFTPRDKQESTGVGLAIVKKVIELYGGKIWVESEIGKSTTFFFTLPKLPGETIGKQ